MAEKFSSARLAPHSVQKTASSSSAAEQFVITSYSIHYTKLYDEDIQKEFDKAVDFNELEKRLGIKSFVIEKMYQQGLKLEKERRDRIIKMCSDADYLAKRGRVNDVAAVESLVINLMSM